MRKVRRSPFPPTITGIDAAGRGYDVVSGRLTRSPAYALVPAAHSARIVSMPASSASSRSRAGGKGIPYAACSRSHHPAPTPTNARPPVSASSVAAALAVMPAGRKVMGETSVPRRSRVSRPATSPRVTHGSGIGSQARSTCGIWMRWSITASPGEAGLVRGQRHRPQPGGRLLAPREARELEHHGAAPATSAGRRSARTAGAGASATTGESGVTTCDHVPALVGELDVADLAEPLELAGERRGRDDVRAVRVAPSRLLGRGVDHDGDRREPGGAGRLEPGPATAAVEAQGVDDGGQAAREAAGDDALEEVEGLVGGLEVVLTAADDGAELVGGDDLVAAVVRGGEMRLARPRGSDEDHECGIGQGLHGQEVCQEATLL